MEKMTALTFIQKIKKKALLREDIQEKKEDITNKILLMEYLRFKDVRLL